MIELTAGMHRDLTGQREYQAAGRHHGFHAAADGGEDTRGIEAFAELGEWMDKPVWQYSSGMQARLGFSVAVNVDADILLIDEVLSVGDVNFQKKCLNRMDELSNSGVTVIFVTHNPYAIERLCDRAIYVHEGRIAASGTPADILNAYFLKSMDKSTVIAGKDVLSADLREGTGAFRVTEITMHDVVSGEEISWLFHGRFGRFPHCIERQRAGPVVSLFAADCGSGQYRCQLHRRAHGRAFNARFAARRRPAMPHREYQSAARAVLD